MKTPLCQNIKLKHLEALEIKSSRSGWYWK